MRKYHGKITLRSLNVAANKRQNVLVEKRMGVQHPRIHAAFLAATNDQRPRKGGQKQ